MRRDARCIRRRSRAGTCGVTALAPPASERAGGARYTDRGVSSRWESFYVLKGRDDDPQTRLVSGSIRRTSRTPAGLGVERVAGGILLHLLQRSLAYTFLTDTDTEASRVITKAAARLRHPLSTA